MRFREHQIAVIPFFIMFAFFVVMLFAKIFEGETNLVTDYDHGIAVDSNENVYIGEHSEIHVFDSNGNYLRSIFTVTHDTYAFTITAEDKILVTTTAHLSTLDLDGTLLEKEDIETPSYDVVELHSHDYFISPENEVYQLKHKFFRPTIVRLEDEGNEEVVYQISVRGCVLRVVREISTILFLISALVFFWTFCKLNFNKKTRSDEERRNIFYRWKL